MWAIPRWRHPRTLKGQQQIHFANHDGSASAAMRLTRESTGRQKSARKDVS